MAGWGYAAAAGASLVGASLQSGSGKNAKKLARKNRDFVYAETAEEVRRLTAAQEQVIAKTRGAQAASGIELGGGSMDTYIIAMEENFKTEIDWMKQSGRRRADIAREGGGIAQDQANAQAWGSVANAIASFSQIWA